MSKKCKTAILISGRGSNMARLIEAAKADDFPAQIAFVLANRPDARGLALAEKAGIEAKAIDHKAFADRQTFEAELQKTLVAHDIELVVLAGFMRKLTSWFTGQWEGRMINIHPSLLPKYKGLHTHQRAIDAGDHQAGCTVHYVTAELDGGPVIMQAKVPVLASDSAESLAERVLVEEHRIFPLALEKVARRLLEDR